MSCRALRQAVGLFDFCLFVFFSFQAVFCVNRHLTNYHTRIVLSDVTLKITTRYIIFRYNREKNWRLAAKTSARKGLFFSAKFPVVDARICQIRLFAKQKQRCGCAKTRKNARARVICNNRKLNITPSLFSFNDAT